MREFTLPDNFINYLEKKSYEYFRYYDLLENVNKTDMDFSEKEWQNSWDYYSNLYRDAYIQYALVKNFITKNLLMTKEQKDKNLIWKVSYSRKKLFVGKKEEFENF